VTEEHVQQLDHIEAVDLGPPATPVHFDAEGSTETFSMSSETRYLWSQNPSHPAS
jgi:hypothetical protein